MNSSAQAALQASIHSSSVAWGLPQRRLSRIVPENRVFFCSTTETWFLNTSVSYLRTSTPPTQTEPSSTSYSRQIRLTRLLFPEPVPPMTPIVSPLLICRSISDNAFFPLPCL